MFDHVVTSINSMSAQHDWSDRIGGHSVLTRSNLALSHDGVRRACGTPVVAEQSEGPMGSLGSMRQRRAWLWTARETKCELPSRKKRVEYTNPFCDSSFVSPLTMSFFHSKLEDVISG